MTVKGTADRCRGSGTGTGSGQTGQSLGQRPVILAVFAPHLMGTREGGVAVKQKWGSPNQKDKVSGGRMVSTRTEAHTETPLIVEVRKLNPYKCATSSRLELTEVWAQGGRVAPQSAQRALARGRHGKGVSGLPLEVVSGCFSNKSSPNRNLGTGVPLQPQAREGTPLILSSISVCSLM